MVINVKYYVITIVSIFFAIGIGIFVGIMLDGQDLIVKQQEDILKQVEQKFDEYKTKQDELERDISQLSIENEKKEKVLETIFPQIIKGKLLDTKVLVIETNQHMLYTGIQETLDKSGAQSVTRLVLKDKLYSKEELNPVENKEVSKESIINKLLNNIFIDKTTDEIKKLTTDNFIEIRGELQEKYDYVILASGESEELKVYDRAEVPIIKFCRSKDIKVIAVEKSDCKISKIKEFKKMRMSTVDNIDKTEGKLSLVMILTGQNGNYGQKESADRIIPLWFKE